jgi:Tol biopolymer transport system component
MTDYRNHLNNELGYDPACLCTAMLLWILSITKGKNTRAIMKMSAISTLILWTALAAGSGTLGQVPNHGVINGLIAFTSQRDLDREIYVMNPDGTDQRRLTTNPGLDDYPSWSPSGARIAYLSGDAAGQYSIKLMDANGANQHRLTSVDFRLTPHGPGCGESFSLAWSPDGKNLAFQENGEIYSVSVDGRPLRVNLTNNPAQDSEPAWSRDGQSILFVSDRSGFDANAIYMIPSAGSPTGTATIFWSPGYVSCSWSPDWSPDGKRIALVFNDAGDFGGQLIVSDNGNPYNYALKPKWSPDGNHIVFGRIYDSFPRHGLWILSLDNGRLRPLPVPESDANASWGRRFDPITKEGN